MSRRETLGSICKRKDGKGRYLKVSQEITLKKDEYLNIESKAEQLASLEEAQASGRLSAENAGKARERIEKIPDFVMFEVFKVVK